MRKLSPASKYYKSFFNGFVVFLITLINALACLNVSMNTSVAAALKAAAYGFLRVDS